MELKLAFHAAAAADRVLAEDDAVLGWFDGEHAQVKGPLFRGPLGRSLHAGPAAGGVP